MTSTRRSPAERKTQIVRMLKTRPRTAPELVEALGMSAYVIGKYIRELHGSRIHIADWPIVRGEGMWRRVAQWAAGPGPDALKPPPRNHNAMDCDISNPMAAGYLDSKRHVAVRRAEALASELRKLPSANPLQALVQATLYAGHGGGLL